MSDMSPFMLSDEEEDNECHMSESGDEWILEKYIGRCMSGHFDSYEYSLISFF